MKCRFCNTELTHVFCDLGHQPPSNAFLTLEQLDEPEMTYPLKVMVCDRCWLVQLPEIAKATDIFKDDYPYYSSQSPANVSHAKAFAEIMVERFHPRSVLEIGSNDGYLLQWFQGRGMEVMGMDPSPGCVRIARDKGIITYKDFFGVRSAKEYSFDIAPLDLICGINVLAHQPDINDFVGGLKVALAPKGIITMEFPHLMRLIECSQFDTIYHEHYNYFSLATIREIFEKHLLSVFDVDEIPEHGGSLRIYARHHQDSHDCLTRDSDMRVQGLLLREGTKGMFAPEYYSCFQYQIDSIKTYLVRFLVEKKQAGISVVAYGAAAKASTFLNTCGIRKDLLPYVVDRSPHKVGKFMPGSHIPVVDELRIKVDKPDYVLITAWNLRDEIMEQLSYIREWGGQFVVAVPELEIL